MMSPSVFALPTTIRRLASAVIVAVCAGCVVGALLIRPSLQPDPAYGLLVYQSMRAGAPWNHMTEARDDDIAKDRTYFYATWSPGQYAVPGVLMDLGMSLGSALTIVGITASLAGLAGWLLLYRTLGYDWTVALVACAVIVTSRSFTYSFLGYWGGDLLTFVAFPYLAVAAYRVRFSLAAAIVTVPLLLIGFFFKNTMAIYMSAWIGSTALMVLGAERVTPRSLRRFVAVAFAAAATVAFLQWSYNSRGWTALAQAPPAYTGVATYLTPLSMPLLAGTGWGDLLSWLFSHPARPQPVFDYLHSVPFLAAVVGVSALGAWSAIRSPRHSGEARHAVVFAVLLLSVFTYLIVTAPATNLDLSRHYRLIGYVLLPIIVHEVSRVRWPGVRAALAVALLLPCLYGVTSFAANWRRHYAQRPPHSSRTQLTHLQLTPRVVGFLAMLDRELPGGTTLVVTPTPMHALEFSRSRVLATSAASDPIERIRATPRSGVVDNLVVVAEMPGLTEPELQAWLASFRSYPLEAWQFLDVDDHRVYVPAQQPVDVAWLAGKLSALDSK